MARGEKHNDKIKERARALLAVNDNVEFVARELNLPASTIRTWKKSFEKEKGSDSFAELRAKKKEEFINSSWRLIDKVNVLIERRLDRAIQSEDLLDELVEEINALDGKTLTYPERMALNQKMRTVKVDSVKELAVLLGTIFDKQEAAGRGATNDDDALDRLVDSINRMTEER